MNRRSLLAATGLLFFTTSLFAQAPPAEEGCARFAGHWEGRMARGTAALDVSFDFRPAGGALAASFNAPDLRALGIPLTAVRCGEGIHFELVGDESATVFDGTLAGGALSGSFREGESTGSFVMRRTEPGPTPYREEEVRFRNGAAVLTRGTGSGATTAARATTTRCPTGKRCACRCSWSTARTTPWCRSARA